MKHNKVFLHVGTNSFFNSQFELAKSLKKLSFECIFYFDNKYPTLNADLAKLENFEFNYVLDFVESWNEYSKIDLFFQFFFKSIIPSFILKKIVSLNYIILSSSISLFFIDLYNQLKKYRRLLKLFKECNFRAIILLADIVQYDTGLIIKASKRCKVKSIILPMFAANHKEACEYLIQKKEHYISDLTFEIINKTFLSKWVLKYKNINLIRLPFYKICVKEILSISPFNPWVVNYGFADLIALESLDSKKKHSEYLKDSFSEMLIVGSVNLDKLYNQTQNKKKYLKKISESYNFDSSKKNVLVALPPDLIDIRNQFCEFSTYQELLIFWMDSLKFLNSYNIFICVHPSSDKNTVFENYNYFFWDKPTIDLIGLIDLYIASISSTIQWAASCSIPVINYDVYKFEYDDYLGYEGILYSNNQVEFIEMLEKINQEMYLNEIKKKQVISSINFGKLDGNSIKKIVEIL